MTKMIIINITKNNIKPFEIIYDQFLNCTYLFVEYHQVYFIDIKSCRILKDMTSCDKYDKSQTDFKCMAQIFKCCYLL